MAPFPAHEGGSHGGFHTRQEAVQGEERFENPSGPMKPQISQSVCSPSAVPFEAHGRSLCARAAVMWITVYFKTRKEPGEDIPTVVCHPCAKFGCRRPCSDMQMRDAGAGGPCARGGRRPGPSCLSSLSHSAAGTTSTLWDSAVCLEGPGLGNLATLQYLRGDSSGRGQRSSCTSHRHCSVTWILSSLNK